MKKQAKSEKAKKLEKKSKRTKKKKTQEEWPILNILLPDVYLAKKKIADIYYDCKISLKIIIRN